LGRPEIAPIATFPWIKSAVVWWLGAELQPVAQLDSVYIEETLKLADQIETYMNLDVYDKTRVPLIKDMKVQMNAWVSKYARGGSARTQVRVPLFLGRCWTVKESLSMT